MDVAVVGGGIIGLSIAWSLQRAGARVSVFDAGRVGRGASWAAGGMLAAHVEEDASDPAFLNAARTSQTLWPGFAAALEAASGEALAVDRTGTIVATFDPIAAQRWRGVVRRASPSHQLTWLEARQARSLEPSLAADCIGAVSSALDGQVDPRAAVSALIKAARSSGVQIHEDEPVLAVEERSGRVTGIVTPTRTLGCDAAVIAAGAWSGRLTGPGLGADLPVRPVKGQMACLAWDQPGPMPRRVIWGPDVYLIPRQDGRLLVGATVEDADFDPRLTAGAMARLLSAATRVLPQARECGLVEMWAGFRPAAPDRRPLIGLGALDGLTIATGHHRNGILLAPVTADVVCDLVLGAPPRHDLSSFSPSRFWRAGPRREMGATPGRTSFGQSGGRADDRITQ
ncbi:MAG: glycine oxidase ThiO [Alphaproteobacteria bacterium]